MQSPAQQQHAQLRRKRFVLYIQKGLNSREIGDLEGMDFDAARKLRNVIAKEEGFAVPKSERGQFVPHGLSETDIDFRYRLHRELDRLTRLHTPEELAVITGLKTSEQKLALNGKYMYNWTIAQIYRLAAARKMTFRELIELANVPDQLPRVGGKQKT